VVAGQAQDGLAQRGELAPEMGISARIVLDQVSRGENGLAGGYVIPRGSQRCAQGRQGGHAAQPARRIREQVLIRELNQVYWRFSQFIQRLGI
jgi:hypothetical protein